MADLKRTLGDVLDRQNPDGVFHVAPGGPGSVPALSGLDVPELHLDLLPGEVTVEQAGALRSLGYEHAADGRWSHGGGHRVVLPDEGSGWRARQAALRALLLSDDAAAGEYRRVHLASGRGAADAALWPAALAHHARTVGWTPLDMVARILAPLNTPWTFAAGAALDLHLGEVTRPHDDLDVLLDRGAQPALRPLLAGWRVDAVRGGRYTVWDRDLDAPDFQLHARSDALPGVLFLDLMLGDFSGGLWRYRRDPAITRPLAQARRVRARGLPYLAPELVLLYKSATRGAVRPKDQADFDRVLPTLGADARGWLRDALESTQPGHRWLGAL